MTDSHALQQPINRRYQLNERLGQGGMGTVYRAYDRLTQTTVALKMVSLAPYATLTDPALSLALEFRTLASLRHPYIVAVLDYGFGTDNAPYYTMQLLEQAQPITDYAAGLSQDGIIGLMLDTLQALIYLHRRGIIHRDLKPANVLVTPDGILQVLDFGLAIQRGTPEALNVAAGGTLPYMAPEAFLGEPPSVADDLYAVGVMLYELLAGYRPFIGTTLGDLIPAILNQAANLEPIPFQLRQVVGQLLAKESHARYPSADAVIAALCEATDRPRPPESLSVRESFLQASAFVGRETEFGALNTALTALKAGQGSFWLVGGESGVGKSRLIDELRTRALVQGVLVLKGQAISEGGLPYHVWRDVVRRLVLESTLSDLEAGVLTVVVPDIDQLLGRTVPPAPELTGSAGQQRLVQTIVDLFRRHHQPTVLFLEDMQWAEESLLPLRQLLSTHEQVPQLMVVATYRDDERPSLPDELAGMAVLSLPRLDGAAVAALAQAMLGEAGARPALVGLLQRETEGNAFFVVETVRALAEEAGDLDAIGRADLPANVFAGGIQRIVTRRLHQLPLQYHPLLKLAAVAGRALDRAMLHAVAAGPEPDAFLTAGVHASVLEVAEGQWRFSHDKLREAVLAGLSTDERRQLNQRIAEVIEAIYPHNPAYHETLMEHWRAAGNKERELSYLLPLTHHLTETVAEYERAERVAAHGVALLADDDERLVVLLNRASKIAHRRGAYDHSIDLAQRALRLAEAQANQNEIAQSLNNLGVAADYQGNFRESQAYHQRSLAIYRALDNRTGIAHGLISLGGVTWSQGDYETAKGHYQESLALYRSLSDQRGSAAALIGLGVVYDLQGDYATAHDYYNQSLDLYRVIGNKHGIAECLNNLGAISVATVKLEAAIDYFEQSLAICRDIGDQQGVAIAYNNLGEMYVLRGAYAEADHYLQEALALRQAIGDKWGLASSHQAIGTSAHRRGNHSQAHAMFQQCIALRREMGDSSGLASVLASYADLQLDRGDSDLASTIREGLALAFEAQAWPNIITHMAILGRWLLLAGDDQQAAQVAGLVEAHPALPVEARFGPWAVLMAGLRARVEADTLAAWQAAGAAKDAETVARDLLAQDWTAWVYQPPVPSEPTPAEAPVIIIVEWEESDPDRTVSLNIDRPPSDTPTQSLSAHDTLPPPIGDDTVSQLPE